MANTAAAYIGASFTLLMGVGSLVGAVASVISGAPVLFDLACGGIAAVCGVMVYLNDWPRVWQPLFVTP